ncbi:MAG: TIR domain-containing protein [Lewinella sp.]|nr:TIR domain-containing protein [Lewinella sp.]
MPKPAIIQTIETATGQQLNPVDDLRELMKFRSRNTFAIDEQENVIGLNLCKNNLSDKQVAFLEDPALHTLQALNLSENKLTRVNLPKAITGLKFLNLSENGSLTTVTFPDELPDLEEVQLEECVLVAIRFPGKLKKLKRVDLRKNKLTAVEFPDGYPALEWLDLSENQLTAFNLARQSGNLKELFLKGNKTTTPPEETVEKGSETTLRFLRELLTQGEREVYEVKMLIVGEGETGKTTLWHKLQDPDWPVPNEEQKSTVGIGIKEGWSFMHLDRPGVQFYVNIWDFGGQAIQYMTHQFFLTRRSFYVLLADGRREVDNFSYWFKIINLLGCEPEMPEKLPVLVVLNEKGNPLAKISYDLLETQKSFPKLTVIKREVDFAKKDGRLEALITTMQDILCRQLAHLPLKFPKNWDDVRQALYVLRRSENHINYDRYRTVCLENEVTEPRAMYDLSGLLHDLGVILHFSDDPRLRDFIVLNPEWAVNAVYEVLRHPDVEKENQGRFDMQILTRVWDDCGYTPFEQGHLLNLMLKDSFEVCFKAYENGREIYIAPQLLPDTRPGFDWEPDGLILRYIYQYSFMPKGIVGRLIVRIHDYIETREGKKIVWMKGAALDFKNGGCRGLVTETADPNDGRQLIKIEITGRNEENRKHFLWIVREALDQIHTRSFPNLKVEQKIPCCCDQCLQLEIPNYYDLSDLENRRKKEKETAECRVSFEYVAVDALIGSVFPRDEHSLKSKDRPQTQEKEDRIIPQKVFFSYSKHDREMLEELQEHLYPLQRESKIIVWDDHRILPGEEWDEKIKTELAQADIILLLVSVKFLNTKYIWDIEITEAMERHKRKEARVIPVILKPCDWQGMPFGKLNGLPIKGKAVTSYDDRDEGWMEVVKGIKNVLDFNNSKPI